MLVLTRRVNESIVIDNNITITILGMKGSSVRIGIDAPRDVAVHRAEVQERIRLDHPPPLLTPAR